MNLRILKKLSKRAAPLLPKLGVEMEQFRADPDDSGYIATRIHAHKHLERWTTEQDREPYSDQIKRLTRDGKRWVYLSHPMARKGTIMVGGVSGYYEPEWSEESAWCCLRHLVYHHFIDYGDDGEKWELTRPLKTPTQVFAAARYIIATSLIHEQSGDRK